MNFVCIIGDQCAGKSHISKKFVDIFPNSELLQIGNELRNRYNADQWKSDKNVAAPDHINKEVENIIADFITFCDDSTQTVILDSYPRNEFQLEKLTNIKKTSRGEIIVFYVTANVGVRYNRYAERSTSIEYFNNRENQDKINIPQIIHGLKKNGIEVIKIESSN